MPSAGAPDPEPLPGAAARLGATSRTARSSATASGYTAATGRRRSHRSPLRRLRTEELERAGAYRVYDDRPIS